MICPECGKEFLAADKECPYCGAAIEEKAEIAKETTETVEDAAETVEETVEEVTETVEETVEEETETVDEVADGDAEDEAERIREALAIAEASEKKAKRAVNILAALIVVAALVIAALLFVKFSDKANGDAEETTGVTEVSGTADTTAATVEVTGDTVSVKEPFEGRFPEDFELKYKDGFDYKSIDINEYVTLGEYKNQTVEVTMTPEFTDEEFESYVKYFLLQYAEDGAAVTDRAAQLSDTVVIDYKGTLNGVAFEGGTAENQTVTLGVGQYIPGFEEGIVGMNIGETKDINVTFPADYGAEALAGKAVVFTITLHSITESVLPEYNDEFVTSNFGISTVAEFEKELRAMRAEEAMSERRSAVLEILTKTAKMSKFPEGSIEDYVYQQISSDKYAAANYSMSLGEYVNGYYGITAEQYEAQVEAMATDMVTQEFALYAVAAAEGLTVTDEDIAAEIGNYLEYYGQTDVQALCTSMGISEELFNNSLHFSVVYTKVMDFMMENTTFIVVE